MLHETVWIAAHHYSYDGQGNVLGVYISEASARAACLNDHDADDPPLTAWIDGQANVGDWDEWYSVKAHPVLT